MTYWQVIAAVGVGSLSVLCVSISAAILYMTYDDIRRIRR